MSAYRASASGLLRFATEGTLADRVNEQVRMTRGYGAGQAEQRSWSRSLAVLAQDLVDAGLGQVEVLAEYQLPLTSKRIDAVLAGVDPRTGDDSFVVVELKQWSYATAYEDSRTLVAVEHARGPRLHPGEQVAGYCEYLTDFLGVLDDQRNPVHGLAYLHNAVDRDVRDLFDRPPTEQSLIFTKQRRGQLLDYLRERLAPVSGAPAADRLLGSSVRPSKQLLNHATSSVSPFDRVGEYLLAGRRRGVGGLVGGDGAGGDAVGLRAQALVRRREEAGVPGGLLAGDVAGGDRLAHLDVVGSARHVPEEGLRVRGVGLGAQCRDNRRVQARDDGTQLGDDLPDTDRHQRPAE